LPYGYQKRTVYGKTMTQHSGVGWPYYPPFTQTIAPVLGIEYVYSYRSGKRSKDLEQQSEYDSFHKTDNLRDSLIKRKGELEKTISQIMEPQVGSNSVFSTTDTGHAFSSWKFKIEQPYGWQRIKTSGQEYAYFDICFPLSDVPIPDFSNPFGTGFTRGGAWNRFSYYTWPAAYPYGASVPASQQILSRAVHNSLATGLIGSANPWKPKASLAVTIIELMTGDVPTVFKNLRKYLSDLQSLKRTAGSDWLNLQFGWVPLVSDVIDAVRVLFQLHMLLYGSASRRRKREGELGTWRRIDTTSPSDRGVYFGTILGSKVLKTSGNPQAPSPINASGSWSRTFTVTADYRFTARYHQGAVPNATENGYLDRATHLLGLELTPDVLWQLTPWTWLLDWASNLGAVSQNLTDLNWSNVLLDYAYLTYKVKTESATALWSSGRWTQGDFVFEIPSTLFSRATSVETIREQASPFGFSAGWSGLSPFQLSILAALGMSRGR